MSHKDPTPLRQNLWEVAVLAFLEEGPMHPYEMRRLLRRRRKDEVLALKPGSLYNAISRLERLGLIEPQETVREGKRPERTVYRGTDLGAKSLHRWIGEMISRPAVEPTDFFAGLSYLVYLTPEKAMEGLEQRAAVLREKVAALEATIRTAEARVGRINLIEAEYELKMATAEIDWIVRIVGEIRSGTFRWTLEEWIGRPEVAEETAK